MVETLFFLCKFKLEFTLRVGWTRDGVYLVVSCIHIVGIGFLYIKSL